jgi:hypothetical protein
MLLAKRVAGVNCDESCLQELSILDRWKAVWFSKRPGEILFNSYRRTKVARQWLPPKRKAPAWMLVVLCSAVGFAAIITLIALMQYHQTVAGQ